MASTRIFIRVELPLLYYVVVEHLVGGNVGLGNLVAGIFAVAAGLGVIYLEAVEHVAHFYLILVGEDFAAVEVFVGRDFALDHQTHDDAEEVFLAIDDVFGEIQRGVFLLGEVEAAVNLAHVCEIGVVRLFVFEEGLHTVGDDWTRGLGFLPAVFFAAFAYTSGVLHLCHQSDSGEQDRQCRECYFTI